MLMGPRGKARGTGGLGLPSSRLLHNRGLSSQKKGPQMFRIQSKLQAAFAVHWFWLKAPQSTSCPKVVVPRPAKAIAIITSDLPREAAI